MSLRKRDFLTTFRARWDRVRVLSAIVVGVGVVAAGFAVARSVPSLGPSVGLNWESALDVLSAMDIISGVPRFHGIESINVGSLDPGPRLFFVKAAGMSVAGSTPAAVSAAWAVLAFLTVLLAASLALQAYWASLGAALFQIVGFTLWMGGWGLPDPGVAPFSHPPLGGVSSPAVAAFVVFALAPCWGLVVYGRWALVVTAVAACVAFQVYLPAAPAALVVLVVVLVWAYRFRRTQLAYSLATVVVVLLGMSFLVVRLLREGAWEVAQSFVGRDFRLFSQVPAAVEVIGSATIGHPLLWLLPLPGAALGVLVWWVFPRTLLLRPLAASTVSSGVLTVLLGVTLVAGLTRPGGDWTIPAWPLQAALVAHGSVVVALVVTLLASGVVLVFSALTVRLGSVRLAAPFVISSCAAAVFLLVALAAVSPVVNPWPHPSHGETNVQAVVAELVPAGDVTFVTALSNESAADVDARLEQQYANIVIGVWESGVGVCWPYDKLPTAASQESACPAAPPDRVLTMVLPSWPSAVPPPGVEVAYLESSRGRVPIREASADAVREWFAQLPEDGELPAAAARAYCGVLDCSGGVYSR